MTLLQRCYLPALALAVSVMASPAIAQTSSAGMFDDIENRFRSAATGWATVLTGYATTLFVALAIISMVVTFGVMAIRRADLGEFFAEFVRFLLFTGFFLWLLRNGPAIAGSIIRSMQQMGQEASGLPATVTPSSIVDIGFDILDRMLEQSSFWEPVDTAVGLLISIGILVVLGLVAINMLLLLISAWIMAFGGIFFLGFGGSRWTSDFAISYFKVLLGVAGSLFGMVLVVGIGKSFLDQFYTTLGDAMSIKDVAVVLVVTVILLFLVNKVPALIAGILTGASVNAGSMVGGAGAGTAFAAAGLAGAAIATGGAALAGGAASLAGGGSAIGAAFRAAQSSISGGEGSGSSGSAGGSGAGSSGGGGGGGGGTPLSAVMGANASTSGGGGSGGGGVGSSGGFTPGPSTIGNLARAGSGMAMDAVRARIGRTTGGQMAERIRQGSMASNQDFAGDAISGGGGVEPANDEVAAFANRNG